jgi:hypothetical protein
MAPKAIHIIGIDPGGTTGYCRLTIPRLSIFGDEPPEILDRDYGEFNGLESEQAVDIASFARQVQSMDYKVGPALVIEDWDIDPRFKSTDPETLSPVRLGAMLTLLRHMGKLNDATLTFQGRSIAKQTMTDDRLKSRNLYVPGSEHIRDAHRHALTALRRAREKKEFAVSLWPHLAH